MAHPDWEAVLQKHVAAWLPPRRLYLGLVCATGSVALVYQVLWQRYFSLLLGSDARSSTLLVAVFLLGLSCGYAFFGRLSTTFKDRREFLKFYGLVEMAIGVYALLFPLWFKFFDQVVPGLTESLGGQLLATLLLIFLPTFGMGATIPVMTSVMPEQAYSINSDHAQIYGLNTLGAMLGVWFGALLVVPYLGLGLGMTITGILNIVLATPYVANQLTGTIEKKNWVQDTAPSGNLSSGVIYAIVFVSGLSTLGLEVVWFRLWGLTIGGSHLVFPMVLSIFVAGLGWGSLSLKNDITPARLKRLLLISVVLLIVSYRAAPYLPYWLSHWRILLTNLPPNYPIFYMMAMVMLACLLMPVLFCLGQLLPMAYALLPKDGFNYGARCAWLYFLNTLGTFIGALLIGHLLLYFCNINTVYMIIIGSVFGLWIYLSRREIVLHWYWPGIVLALMIITALPWNRRFHELGTFRDHRQLNYHFKGAFSMPKSDYHFLEDGPNATVSVTGEKERSLSIVVNGKSDSSTRGDYSTITLLAIYPYLYQEKVGPYRSLVIGLGTGITAGLLASLEKTTFVDVVEISNEVKKANKLFKNFNYDLLNNNKATIHIEDAFHYFKRPTSSYDIIVSEPSNPWVVGIENLFTTYFYQMALSKLTENGIFAQWLHVYSLDKTSFATVIENMQQVFPWVRMYNTQAGDVLLMGSKQKLQVLPAAQSGTDPILKEVLTKLGIDDINYLALTEYFAEQDIDFIARTYPTYVHDIDRPALSHHALKSFFLDESVNLNLLIDPYLARHLPDDRHAILAPVFQKAVNSGVLQRIICDLTDQLISSPLCQLRNISQHYKQLKEAETLEAKLESYAILRKHRLQAAVDYQDWLSSADGPYVGNVVRDLLIREMIKDGAHEKVAEVLASWLLQKHITPLQKEQWERLSLLWRERQNKLREYVQGKGKPNAPGPMPAP